MAFAQSRWRWRQGTVDWHPKATATPRAATHQWMVLRKATPTAQRPTTAQPPTAQPAPTPAPTATPTKWDEALLVVLLFAVVVAVVVVAVIGVVAAIVMPVMPMCMCMPSRVITEALPGLDPAATCPSGPGSRPIAFGTLLIGHLVSHLTATLERRQVGRRFRRRIGSVGWCGHGKLAADH